MTAHTILAGTSRGIFSLGDGTTPSRIEPVLESAGVRDLIAIGDRLFAGTNEGLFVSDDRGANWTLKGLGDYQVWQIRDDGAGRLYASTAPAGLFASDDAGDSWTAVPAFMALAETADWCIPVEPPIPPSARALVVRGDELFVGVEVGGIAVSKDRGESWAMVLPGDNPDLHMMFAHPAKPQTLYASTGYGRLDGVAEMIEGNAGVFRSDDGGASWAYAWQGITPRYSRPMCVDARAPYALTVASAPHAFSHYKQDGGSDAMLFRSDDGGESWRSLCDEAHSPSLANFHGLTADPDNLGGVLVGTDSGEVWRVSDSAEWQLCGQGMSAVMSIAAV